MPISETICYCYGFTREDIVADLRENDGRSTIVERLRAARQTGECRCHEAHPEGR